MNVLNCFLDNRFGGPQRRAASVAHHLRERGIETVFLFNEKEAGGKPISGFECFLIRHMQCLTRESTVKEFVLFVLCFFGNVRRIRQLLKSHNIHIVHVNGLLNVLPALAGRSAGVKIVWHLNDTVTPASVRRLLVPLLRRWACGIAVASKRVGGYYFGTADKLWQRTRVLYAPVDMQRFDRSRVDESAAAALRNEFGLSGDVYVLGAVGNINRAKGYAHLIEAAGILRDRIPQARFLIIGEPLHNKSDYYQALLDRVEACGLKDRVLFAGFRGDVATVLSVFDVLILPSVTEACPMAVLEAMAMKVPVVATDVGGVREQIIDGQTGVVVRPGSGEALAGGILRMHGLPTDVRRDMVEQGHHRAEAMFSLEHVVRAHIEIYEAVLDTPATAFMANNQSCREPVSNLVNQRKVK
ncbi:MAG: glycosyltransferase family 4 protein [Phycisphaerae bacterium]|nr:glycosyltransferase family 4 protein [Phycisphaerae bacterium]